MFYSALQCDRQSLSDYHRKILLPSVFFSFLKTLCSLFQLRGTSLRRLVIVSKLSRSKEVYVSE